MAKRRTSAGADLDVDSEPLRPLLQAVVESQTGREDATYKISLSIRGPTLIPMPRRFKGRF